MRFDDSLETVLAGELGSVAAVHSTWRQIVDLLGRRRATASPAALARLRAIRGDVTADVRVASARGLEPADPPVELVALFVEDEPKVAAPVVRSARLTADEWIALLPTMMPATRLLLRNRRDLPDAVGRALAAFGGSDLVLPPAELADAIAERVPAAAPPDPAPVAPRFEPAATSFVSLAEAAQDLPILAEARRAAAEERAEGGFRIADVMARIDEHRREHGDQPPRARAAPVPANAFRFETDAQGLIRWIDGAERAALIGISLDVTDAANAQVDGNAGGAFRRRAPFRDARLEVGGNSDAAGSWRISATPAFDPASGRFTGYRGHARRPRPDEQPQRTPAPGTDGLRQLVHELRTPTNAIAGFAEMIESELIGPVPAPYRDQARAIREQVHGLIGAIDDLDYAARIEARALDLHSRTVAVRPLLMQVATELAALAAVRGAALAVAAPEELAIAGDSRAVERVVSRLTAALLAASSAGQTIAVDAHQIGGAVEIGFDRPTAFADDDGGALFAAAVEAADDPPGAPLLGSGFGLRLARRLAVELGGAVTVGGERLTLRLPAAVTDEVGQATV